MTDLKQTVAELEQRLQASLAECDELLQQRGATNEVLQVINASSGDLAPVFDAILERAMRLCEAEFGLLATYDGGQVRTVATRGVPPAFAEFRKNNPPDYGPGTGPARILAGERVVHIDDLKSGDAYRAGDPNRRAVVDLGGARTVLLVPLLKNKSVLGYITIYRKEVRPYSDKQIVLLQNFADQAVIAIENARLFNETQETLERQTATADILKVIAGSPTDVQPVFDAIAESAKRLLASHTAVVTRVVDEVVHLAASTAESEAPAHAARGLLPYPLSSERIHARVARTGQVAVNTDAPSSDLPQEIKDFARTVGWRSMLVVPMLRNEIAIGTIGITRREPGTFDDKTVDLLKTFANQAVIAIENARLFDEVQAKTRDLEESLQQQTATADVLTVISRSAFDLDSVLNTLVESAVTLSGADAGTIYQKRGELYHVTAGHGHAPEVLEYGRANPLAPSLESNVGRTAMTGALVHITDVLADPDYASHGYQRVGHYRAMLGIPLKCDGKVEGVFSLVNRSPGPFEQRHIDLVQTFADQAVIAIENARLFNEVQTKSRDLQEALRYQTGSANILNVIASSPTDVQPVLKAIVESACELCEAHDAVVLLKDGNDLCFSAHHGPIPINTDRWPIGRGWASGRAVVDRETVHVHDIYAEDDFTDGRELSRRAGSTAVRSILAAPLLREGESIGAILLRRQEVRPFNDKQIALLQTFADQAVIAIENARLFNETKEALERQTATAEVLKIIAASPTDVQPVFEAIVQTAVRLLGCETSFIQRCDSSSFWSVARCRKEGLLPLLNARPGPIDPAANFPSRAMLAKQTLYLPDWSEIELPEFERRIQQELGYNCAIYLPLLHKEVCLGVLGIAGSQPRMFNEADIALAEAFRDQVVIAIRNTQLFEEVQQRTRELSQSLEDLRTAQDRLVQTEKLASLGQLTAGIAHEIKNPLNFVNNFAALSAELVGEMTEVFENSSMSDSDRRNELAEIRELLKSNLEKVVQHGKRADSIVKNMLLHSREGSSEQRSADINALLDESLNLAYHGARAEKPGFNITLQRELDPSAGEIELFPQEITRAFLNLISNGFYAASKRQSENGDPDFEPILSAATKNLGNHVEIRIRDNGTGIPAEVMGKIFNPFFTTKPAGEGTGLGLSMSHDIIVKQHGGRIEVDTRPGQFTEFTIILPRTGNMATKQKH